MSKKGWIGCGSIYFLLIIGIVLLAIFVNREKNPVEKRSINYIIEHFSAFSDDFQQMGYDAAIAYTQGDLNGALTGENAQKKAGIKGRGVLVLRNDTEEFWFDVGFKRYEKKLGHGVVVQMGNTSEEAPLVTKKKWDNYPVWVSLSAPEYEGHGTPHNDYTIDFTEFWAVWDDELDDDNRIKKYISSGELCEMLAHCVDLQDALIDLYCARSGEAR